LAGETNQILTLEYIVDTDSLYNELGRALGAKNYQPWILGATVLASLVSPLAAGGVFVGGELSSAAYNSFCNKIEYQGNDVNDAVTYEIKTPCLRSLIKTMAKNFYNWVK
jgi:hypothetical protein